MKKINLKILNILIFISFFIMVVAVTSFFTHLEDSKKTFIESNEQVLRTDTRTYLNEISYDLNKEIISGDISFQDNEELSNWANNNLKYSKNVEKFDNIKIMRVQYDNNGNLKEDILWTLNEDERILEDTNYNTFFNIINDKNKEKENFVTNKDGERLLLEYVSIPTSEIFGLNGEKKFITGKFNPKYEKIIIFTTIRENQNLKNEINSLEMINNFSFVSKMFILYLLVFIIVLMSILIWKYKRNDEEKK